MINCTAVYPLLSEAQDLQRISITVSPDMHSGKVGYKTYTDEDIGALSLNAAQLRELFQPHRTLLITLRLQRYQQDNVFRFRAAAN